MRNNFRISNQKLAYTITVVIVFVSVITIVTPLFFLYTFPTSKLTFMFFSYPNNLMSIIGFLLIIYFVISGVFYFTFKVDNYIIEVKSRRVILGFFATKNNHIEMPKSTILKYAFYNRPFTFNSTLMIKVKVSRKRTVAKRFQLSFLSKKKKELIEQSLEKIIQNNGLDG